jgi:hypothetical protein
VNSYGPNKEIGKGKVTISGKGLFKGSKTIKFDIVPRKMAKPSVTVAKKQMTVSWKQATKAQNISKYQLRYREVKTNEWKTTKTFASTSSSATIKGLRKGGKYEVQVCSYKTVKNVKHYSAWSKTVTSKKIK